MLYWFRIEKSIGFLWRMTRKDLPTIPIRILAAIRTMLMEISIAKVATMFTVIMLEQKLRKWCLLTRQSRRMPMLIAMYLLLNLQGKFPIFP